jgi:phosphoinositide-3-kinase regulatory subunit 4
MMQALRSEGSLAGGNIQSEVGKLTGSSYQHYQNLYDSARNDLMAQFEQHTTTLLTDSDTAVRRAFLGSISTLCVFFGSTRASDVILSHLNTYLNDRDWELKCAFFETIVGVATYVGGPSLEEFILPLMVQSLTDPEETVIERVLRSFSAIAGLGLFQRSTTWELVDIVGRFTMHPNTWIREAAVEFIAAASKYLTVADCHGIIIPLIKVYLSTLPSELSELVLLDVLKKPMPRLVFDMALTWSVKTEKGVFWKAAQTQRTFTFGAGDHNLPTISGQNLGPRAFNRIPKNDEDEQWIQRLRNAGMEHEDEFKLVALREFIWRVAHRKSQVDAGSTPSPLNAVVKLSEINIKPQIVIFDQDHNKFRQTAMRQNGNDQRHRTIAEALQDATSQASNIPAAQDGSRASPQPGPVTIPSRPAASQESDSRVQSPTGLDVPRPKGTLSPLSGPTVSSSLDSKASFRLTDHNHSMARKGSAINLMGRAEAGSKATAELGTTQENAFGQVATGASGREVAKRSSTLGQTIDNHRRNPQRTKQQTAHNYSGNDPGVLRLLDSLYLDNYPVDYIEFGPMFTPRRREPIKRAGGQAATGPWRPDGNLVAFLGEHTAAINRVVVAPDHNFFVTGSDDGTVKVWDTSRLERNTTHRSRHTYRHAPGTKVTSLTFIEDTHCFVSTGSDGSVHIVRVDFTQKHDESSQSSPRYGKLKVVREYSLPDGEHSVWCEHFKEENRSILILATNKCRVIALELRTMTELYVLSNPLHHGTPLCFCVDKKHHWLLLGTSHGILDLWDLRFRLRLKAWGFSAGSPIHRISLVPSRSSRQHKVAIAGGTGQGEVTIWDIEKAICTNVYRTGLSKENTKGYKLIENDEERSGGMLGRFATSSEPSSNAGMDRGIRAIAMGLHVLEGSDPRFYFFVSAGPDWKVRFWDSARHESSMVVSGMELEEGRPSYTVSQPSHDLTVVSETLSPPPPISGSSTASTPVASPARGVVAGSAGKRSGRDKARSSIISMQQQHLLKSHLDTVTDVALLEVPYGMVVSVDRSGLIYVFS